MKWSFGLALLLTTFVCQGAEWKPLSGVYAVTPESSLDPPADPTENSHFRLQLDGQAARDLYRAMAVELIVDDCTGALAKNLGNMQCLSFDDSSYECHFSVNLPQQRIDYGVAC